MKTYRLLLLVYVALALGCGVAEPVESDDEVSIAEAKQSLVGLEITWHGFGGEPHIFIVTENSFVEKVERATINIKVENSFEQRETWRIGIGFPSDNLASWYIYVDTTTGETVSIEQLFVT